MAHIFGPWLVTSDEIPYIYNLRMVARVNGEIWCQANAGTMHWRFEDMIAQLRVNLIKNLHTEFIAGAVFEERRRADG